MRKTKSNGADVALPSNVYPFRDRYFRVAVGVNGVRRTIGTWAQIERAIAERNRALILLAPWLRQLPDDVPPLAEQPGLPPNNTLTKLLTELEFRAPAAVAEGRVAPYAAELAEARKETNHGKVSAARLDRMETTLNEILTTLKAYGPRH